MKKMIETFVDLQSDLVAELKFTLGARDWRYLTDVPRRGEVMVKDTLWRYEVHGIGIRFFSGKVIVDVNRDLDGDQKSFDAGRLAEYLSSIGSEKLIWKGKPIEFDYEHGPSILREMLAAGAIQRADSVDGELYLLPS